jgi:hypothetical protein
VVGGGCAVFISLKQGPIDFVFGSVLWWVHSFARATHVRGETSGEDHRAWWTCDAVAAPLPLAGHAPLILIRIISGLFNGFYLSCDVYR